MTPNFNSKTDSFTLMKENWNNWTNSRKTWSRTTSLGRKTEEGSKRYAECRVRSPRVTSCSTSSPSKWRDSCSTDTPRQEKLAGLREVTRSTSRPATRGIWKTSAKKSTTRTPLQKKTSSSNRMARAMNPAVRLVPLKGVAGRALWRRGGCNKSKVTSMQPKETTRM